MIQRRTTGSISFSSHSLISHLIRSPLIVVLLLSLSIYLSSHLCQFQSNIPIFSFFSSLWSLSYFFLSIHVSLLYNTLISIYNLLAAGCLSSVFFTCSISTFRDHKGFIPLHFSSSRSPISSKQTERRTEWLHNPTAAGKVTARRSQ